MIIPAQSTVTQSNQTPAVPMSDDNITSTTKKVYSKPVLILLDRSGRVELSKLSQSIPFETTTSTPPRGAGGAS
jgi:hypothetical protein